MSKVKDESDGSMTAIQKKSIWKFYRWAVVLAPIMLMLSHWYIFYVFSQNTHELLWYSSANEVCIAWIYSILYLYVPLMILPASYFFKYDNLFRIPFVYFIFINIERIYYGSWFCTNAMIDTHYFLIYCIICLYALELLGFYLRHKSELPKYFKLCLLYISKHKENKGKDNYDRIKKILEDKSHDEV